MKSLKITLGLLAVLCLVFSFTTFTSVESILLSSTPQGELFVNINHNHRVVHYTPEGEIANVIEVEGEVSHMAVGCNGDLFVNINGNHRILHYSLEGELLHEFELDGEAIALAVDTEGTLFVNINGNHRIVRFSAEGEELSSFELEL